MQAGMDVLVHKSQYGTCGWLLHAPTAPRQAVMPLQPRWRDSPHALPLPRMPCPLTAAPLRLVPCHQGFRSGGGLGDVLDSLSGHTPNSNLKQWFWSSTIFSLSFFLTVNIVLLNIVFGIIVDTFSELRTQREEKRRDTLGCCFICGIDRQVFERQKNGVGWEVHYRQPVWRNTIVWRNTMCRPPLSATPCSPPACCCHTPSLSCAVHCRHHNMWNYLRFIVHVWQPVVAGASRHEKILSETSWLFDRMCGEFAAGLRQASRLACCVRVVARRTDAADRTGLENYVAHMITEENTNWFPVGRSIGLTEDEDVGEDSIDMVKEELAEVRGELAEVKEQLQQLLARS